MSESTTAAPEVTLETKASESTAAPIQEESTLLGAGDNATETKPAEKSAETIAADKAAQEVNDKLLKTEDKDLSPEDLAKKQELVKAQTEAGSKVPEKYEFKLPEGMQLDSTLLDKVTPIFKELGITQANAQKLVDAYAPYVKAQAEASVKAQQDASMKVFEGIKKDWKDQTNKILGAEPAKELAHAAKFINKFGSPELRQMLNETGVGNHPELVKLMIAAGKSIAEDTMPTGKKTSSNNEGGIDAKTFYSHPSSPK